ncbi:hypothetical protein M8C13_05185 [Crossiella sp. SN42]|uniref:hypothetical protein n=1 Tax=Crossiella sp. SN42 TaxID=2944808 RepID=UPI00207CA192|nr:hypothetical protein [Crossiella sp. SN42]MCO1575152.1 hypothetical protein [Crossiella sp. SN42]
MGAALPVAAYGAKRDGVPLREAVAHLVVAKEVRDGYEQEKFKHWTDIDRDGCSTRFPGTFDVVRLGVQSVSCGATLASEALAVAELAAACEIQREHGVNSQE